MVREQWPNMLKAAKMTNNSSVAVHSAPLRNTGIISGLGAILTGIWAGSYLRLGWILPGTRLDLTWFWAGSYLRMGWILLRIGLDLTWGWAGSCLGLG